MAVGSRVQRLRQARSVKFGNLATPTSLDAPADESWSMSESIVGHKSGMLALCHVAPSTLRV